MPRLAYLTLPLVAALAAFGSDFAVHAAARIAVFVVAAVALDLVVGWCGHVSLGHGVFFGAGAYGSALLVQAGWPWPAAGAVAIAASATLGLLLGLPALRLTGAAVAMASLGFQMTFEQLWIRGGSLTGGRSGLAVRAQHPFDSERTALLVLAGSAFLVVQGVRHVLRGPAGRALLALRDEPQAAQALGIDARRTRLLAYSSSAALCGLAGALFVSLTDSLHPDQFGLSTSIELLVMVVVGGAASVYGATLGALLLGLLAVVLAPLGEVQTAALGALLLFIALGRPRGLAGRRLA